MRFWMDRRSEEGGLAGTLILFLCYVLLIGATGIPDYLQASERRAREASERRRADEAREREKAEKERRAAIEAELRRPPAAPAGVHGPNVPARPDASSARNGPRNAFDYLPAEQRRMLQPGSFPKEKTR